jgi:hypothetical protein
MRMGLYELFNNIIRFSQIIIDKKKYKAYKNGDMMEYFLSTFRISVSELILKLG